MEKMDLISVGSPSCWIIDNISFFQHRYSKKQFNKMAFPLSPYSHEFDSDV